MAGRANPKNAMTPATKTAGANLEITKKSATASAAYAIAVPVDAIALVMFSPENVCGSVR